MLGWLIETSKSRTWYSAKDSRLNLLICPSPEEIQPRFAGLVSTYHLNYYNASILNYISRLKT